MAQLDMNEAAGQLSLLLALDISPSNDSGWASPKKSSRLFHESAFFTSRNGTLMSAHPTFPTANRKYHQIGALSLLSSEWMRWGTPE
jgi:hypothetical protein